ncbi:MAG: hypothetical protein ABSG84_13285 [Acidobacteriaceae bacterium]|jgi:hypothetical protein
MRKIPPAEWFLSQDIGPERAAAIMGDLEELAATRGRLWFWIAYVRALISLGWRTGGSAFILGLVCLRLMFGTVVPWVMSHRTIGLDDPGLFGLSNPHVRMWCWNLSLVTAQFLVFAFPFVWIRFGMQDRLTRLTCALFFVAMPVYSFRPWLMDLSGVLVLAILIAALVAPAWRKPLAVLAGTFLPAVAVKVTYFFLQAFLPRKVFTRQLYHIPAHWVFFVDAISFAIAAIVCLKLYRLLFPENSATPDAPKPPRIPRTRSCLKEPLPKLS